MSEHRRLWWATLYSGSPRYADWHAILGTDDVPLLYPGSGTTELIGEGKHEVYLLDLSALSEQQMDRLVAFVAKKFRAGQEEVRDGIMREGFPVRAADVTVCFDIGAFI